MFEVIFIVPFLLRLLPSRLGRGTGPLASSPLQPLANKAVERIAFTPFLIELGLEGVGHGNEDFLHEAFSCARAVKVRIQ